MANVTLRPYPWSALDSVRASDALALRSLRGFCESVVRVSGAAGALGGIVGARVVVRVKRVERTNRTRPLEGGLGLVLCPSDAAPGFAGALLEVEGGLATTLVARALKRPVPKATWQQSPSSLVAGAFGAIVLAAARRSHVGGTILIRAAGAGVDFDRDAGGAPHEVDVGTVSVLVDDLAFLARLTVPVGQVKPLAAGPARSAVAALDNVFLELPVVACACGATAAEIATLNIGDAFLPGQWPLVRSKDGALVGPVWLAADDAEYGIRAELGADGRVVLRGERAALTSSAEDVNRASQDGIMGESENRQPLAEAVGEVPVVVRVEIGSARMRARELAELAPGDVVGIGRRLGEAVILRVAGEEIARGELVDLEGEVGVRILSRRNTESAGR